MPRAFAYATRLLAVSVLLLLPAIAGAAPIEPPGLAGVPIDFLLFALTLVGVALFHHHTLPIAVGGMAVISLFKIAFSPFAEGAGVAGWLDHLGHEWVLVANLLGLLLGFALLSKHFEASRVPQWLPKLLPDDWKGGLILLLMIFVLSSFLDNIAAALIGGTIARAVFRGKLHIGYLAAIVAASNAGGSGSVVGDTTTTMMWIDGVNPLQVLEAYIAAGTAMLVFGIPAAIQQQRYSPITREAPVSRTLTRMSASVSSTERSSGRRYVMRSLFALISASGSTSNARRRARYASGYSSNPATTTDSPRRRPSTANSMPKVDLPVPVGPASITASPAGMPPPINASRPGTPVD